MGNKDQQHYITMRGSLHVLDGRFTEIGDTATNFKALKQDSTEFDFYNETMGKLKIISVVPSVDTSICSLQTQRFNQEASTLSEDVVIVTISVDLPFALKRFCAAEGINNIQVVSDHRTLDFGLNYGFVIQDLRLLTRGIVVIDRDNQVRYIEYVSVVSNHPDYEKALAAVKELL